MCARPPQSCTAAPHAGSGRKLQKSGPSMTAEAGGVTLPETFAAAMRRLGPFEPAPRLAAAVSGGADSMALAMLTRNWARAHDGSLLALVVDHRLRPESAAEAAVTMQRLQALQIPARLLAVTGLPAGSAMAERARVARYAALRAACTADGRLHLLLGHHAADQAETVLIRRQGGSGPSGLAAMPALAEQHELRLLRPLLAVPPGQLRDFLRNAGVPWVEDPSNRDLRALRPLLRAMLADPAGTGLATTDLCAAAHQAGTTRAARDIRLAAWLARRATLYPEGVARLSAGPIEPDALAALIQMVSGAAYPAASAAVRALAAAPRAATLSGVRLMPAGRFGDGWLLVREAAAMAPPVPATPGAVWDSRFRLSSTAQAPEQAMLGALGPDAARLRRFSPLPSAALQALPTIRLRNLLVAVPHLLYPDKQVCARLAIGFSPRQPAAGAPFLPA